MLTACVTEVGASFKTDRFSNLTLSNGKNEFMNFKSITNLNPPDDFATKKERETYASYADGFCILRIAPDYK
jgi:hypothetical protein